MTFVFVFFVIPGVWMLVCVIGGFLLICWLPIGGSSDPSGSCFQVTTSHTNTSQIEQPLFEGACECSEKNGQKSESISDSPTCRNQMRYSLEVSHRHRKLAKKAKRKNIVSNQHFSGASC